MELGCGWAQVIKEGLTPLPESLFQPLVPKHALCWVQSRDLIVLDCSQLPAELAVCRQAACRAGEPALEAEAYLPSGLGQQQDDCSVHGWVGIHRDPPLNLWTLSGAALSRGVWDAALKEWTREHTGPWAGLEGRCQLPQPRFLLLLPCPDSGPPPSPTKPPPCPLPPAPCSSHASCHWIPELLLRCNSKPITPCSKSTQGSLLPPGPSQALSKCRGIQLGQLCRLCRPPSSPKVLTCLK